MNRLSQTPRLTSLFPSRAKVCIVRLLLLLLLLSHLHSFIFIFSSTRRGAATKVAKWGENLIRVANTIVKPYTRTASPPYPSSRLPDFRLLTGSTVRNRLCALFGWRVWSRKGSIKHSIERVNGQT